MTLDIILVTKGSEQVLLSYSDPYVIDEINKMQEGHILIVNDKSYRITSNIKLEDKTLVYIKHRR